MLSQLDNNHHRPYEVLVLGYTTDVQIHPLTSPKTEREEAKFTGGKSDDNEMLRKNTSTTFEASDFGISGLPPHGYVVMSVPGEHSRKPPLARIRLMFFCRSSVYGVILSIIVCAILITFMLSFSLCKQ